MDQVHLEQSKIKLSKIWLYASRLSRPCHEKDAEMHKNLQSPNLEPSSLGRPIIKPCRNHEPPPRPQSNLNAKHFIFR